MPFGLRFRASLGSATACVCHTAMPVNFRCPTCHSVILTKDGGSWSVLGNATFVTDFPPADINAPFAKCSDHDVFLVADGAGGAVGGATARLGDTELLPGDWLMHEGQLGGVYYHHFMYIGGGYFVSRQTSGVVREEPEAYQGTRARLVHRGGSAAADRAIARVGERGYNLVTDNCEHFCSEVCGLGGGSEQVVVGSGKLLVATLGLLGGFAQNSGQSYSFVGGISGGISAGRRGFSAGVRFDF